MRAALLLAALLVAWAGGRDESRPYGPAHADKEPVRVLFAGDIMLDGGPGHIVTSGGDPFAHVAAALADADLTIGNRRVGWRS